MRRSATATGSFDEAVLGVVLAAGEHLWAGLYLEHDLGQPRARGHEASGAAEARGALASAARANGRARSVGVSPPK